jgi:hypothetical protein
VWRTLDKLTSARLTKIDKARARVRRHVWSALPGGVPASKVAGTDLDNVVVLDVDATIVIAHSDKEQTAPTHNFGFAGAHTAADHIEVLSAAIA